MTSVGLAKTKVLVLGPESSEKTALVAAHADVVEPYGSALGLGLKVYTKTVKVPATGARPEVVVLVQLWDVSGMSPRPLLQASYFRGARGILVVCDGTSRQILDEIDDTIESAHVAAGDIQVVILVNTKGLPADRVVSEEVVGAWAKTHDAPYFYTSWSDEKVEGTGSPSPPLNKDFFRERERQLALWEGILATLEGRLSLQIQKAKMLRKSGWVKRWTKRVLAELAAAQHEIQHLELEIELVSAEITAYRAVVGRGASARTDANVEAALHVLTERVVSAQLAGRLADPGDSPD